MATLRWRGDKAKRAWRLAAAQRLHNAAVYFVKEAEKLLSNPYPPASRRGQYPRKRSGVGSKGVVFRPATVPGIYRTLRWTAGWSREAWYMHRLEKKLGRLGLRAAARRLRRQLANVLAGRGPHSRSGA
jgi:hypothetical protein